MLRSRVPKSLWVRCPRRLPETTQHWSNQPSLVVSQQRWTFGNANHSGQVSRRNLTNSETRINTSSSTVITLTPYEDIEDAIKMANDSEYSLIAGFWTSNLHEAMKYAPQIRAGSVQVNGSTIHIEPTFGNVRHFTHLLIGGSRPY